MTSALITIAAVATIALIAGFALSAIGIVRELRAKHQQQQLDEHADWLGADAGGSFIHNGSVSE